jgi:putative DNA primase/helicase
MTVSMVSRCHETETHPITFEEIWSAIRNGEHGLKEKITQIRNRYEAEKDITGDPTKAKKAIADLKLQLPGFLPSGTFSKRESAALVEHSGILCADLDVLGDQLCFLREALKAYHVVHAIALSPSGDGLKVFFNVVNDPARHLDSFRTIKKFILDGAGLEVDEQCKDVARICFFTYDPDLWLRLEDNETIEPADPLPRAKPFDPTAINVADLSIRERIATVDCRLGGLTWFEEKQGYLCTCPGISAHTNENGQRDCIVYLHPTSEHPEPTIHCVHTSCGSIIAAHNSQLRSLVGKAEWAETRRREQGEHPLAVGLNGEEPETKEDWFEKIQSSMVLATKEDIGSLVLKPRVSLLSDWLCEGDYGIIFGPRGVAKTWFSLMIANAVATGGTIGEWESPTVKKVLFIDGEMPADMIRDRLLGFGGTENISLLNHEILFDRTQSVINVTNSQQQDALLQLCIQQDFKLMILDNLSVCAFGIKENDSFEWEQLHRWLLQFRRHGIAVILLHHAGKTGQIRGTTKREDAAAWVISLTDAKERSADKRGSRFISYFAKQSRNCMNTMAYEWHVVLDDGRVEINWRLAQGADLVLQCIKDGVSECSMIATEMGVSPATVCRLAKKLQDSGKIEVRGRKYILTLTEELE